MEIKVNNAAVLFSGQGSQYAGMGAKLVAHPIGKETFQEANEALEMDIESICCTGTDKELINTEVNQPAIVTCSIAAFRILSSNNQSAQKLSSDKISAAAGLSVGEYSALVASSVISFKDALKIVKVRGKLMSEASKANPGKMVAIIGLDSETVRSICEEASSSGVVLPTNYNCPGQIVISGVLPAIEKAMELAKKAGARRCIALDVSGAFHSPLMIHAEIGLRKALDGVSFSKPKVPFVANVTGDYVDDPLEIAGLLALQVSNPIQWESSINRMIDTNIKDFFEFGPGKVLSGMVRKISKEVNVYSSEDYLLT